MRSLLLLFLCPLALASVPAPRYVSPTREIHGSVPTHRNGGRWYMAEDGHAVFCYGGEKMIPDGNSGLERVALFCRDGRVIVKLKD